MNKMPPLAHCRQLLRFALVGGTTYVLTVAAFCFLNKELATGRLTAATLSYFLGIAFHFTANKLFTFGNCKPGLHIQVLRYGMVCAINYLISMACLELLVRKCNVPATLAFGLSVATTTVLGYVLLRFWVFAKD